MSATTLPGPPPAAPGGPPEEPRPTPAPSSGQGGQASGRRALLASLRERWGWLSAGVLLGLVGSVMGLAQPLAAKRVVDGMGRGEAVTGAVLLLSALVVAGALLAGLGHYVLQRTAESLVREVRHRLSARLLGMRVGAAEKADPGDLISRVTSDTTVLRQAAPEALAAAVTGTLVTSATLVLMCVLDAVLFCVTLAVIALVSVLIAVTAPRIGSATRRTQEAVGELGAALERVLGAFRTVKAATAEHHEATRLDAAADRACRAGVKAAAWQAVSVTSSAVVMQVCFLVVLGVGGARVASGAISVSTLVAFLLYVFALAPRLSQLVEGVGHFQVGAAAALRIEQVTQLEVEHGGPPGAPAIATAGQPPATATPPDGSPLTVRFDRVRFAYRPGLPPAHRGVSFTVPARGLTAFVGPSGAGKTTVFSLIARFHDPDTGRVLLDRQDAREWPLHRLRTALGYVEQDAPVLAGTLRDNLLLGPVEASEAELARVLRLTRLDVLAARLPQGLDTSVGHRGGTLSGGERQRVAVARALLRRPRLLLLDEATSQLDAVNEAALRDAVHAASRSTTVLVIAHRLSTVVRADQIIVMEDGRVRATGTHAQLMARDSLYAELARGQLLHPEEP
ncbi:ABC transporter ATP-binding protein [Streptomyces sp. JJ66]|uniref:ABC transporter ATP-binding protein n=1 Tax=Streptomyces sp. JJ66 TaxID=2803843 RepID=UPI0027E23E5C|nr:ABC transporter ATP-binding protein [Streptomyces sp. JJ66]